MSNEIKDFLKFVISISILSLVTIVIVILTVCMLIEVITQWL